MEIARGLLVLTMAGVVSLYSSTVCNSGCEYSSIQRAIDDLNNSKGEFEIFVMSGVRALLLIFNIKV